MIILFEDNHVIAVAKPAGLLTQGAGTAPSLEGMVKEYLKERYHKAGNVYLGIPHRLDRPVSGVVLFARSSKAAARLAEQFRERHVAKVYWAAVEGDVQPAEGVWEDWLLKVAAEARGTCVPEGTPHAKHALLRYRRLTAAGNTTLLEFHPETGRMHQIRLQAAARGWPVRGDALYGARTPFGPEAELPRDRVIALHARALTLMHPIRYEPMTVAAPLPASWVELQLPAGFAAFLDKHAADGYQEEEKAPIV